MTIPRPLSDILLVTGVREGADAALKQYRDLRSRYYGRGAYDFGEETLLSVARRLANARSEVAIPDRGDPRQTQTPRAQVEGFERFDWAAHEAARSR